MSQLKLTADGGGGTVSLKGPSTTTGNAAIELTVPGTGSSTLATTATAGKILQIVQFRKTGTFSSSANGFVDIGVAVNITPSATSSKILVTVSISGFVHTGSGGAAKIVRTIGGTATDLGKADASGIRNVSSFSGSLYTGDGTSSDLLQMNANTQFLDSPSTTSQINYKVQCHPENNTLLINYQENSQNTTASGIMTTSYITCMEVAA